MRITNKMHLPDALVERVETERHNRKGNVSATTLLKGTKEIILTDRHWNELEDDVSNRIWALFGTAVHALLEKDGETTFAEEFLSVEYPQFGKRVTGRLDCYDMETGTVYDYKNVSVNKILRNDFADWRRQGMIYAWLLRKNGLEANRICFIALLKDHSKFKARFDRTYPQSPTVCVEWKVTDKDIEETERFIEAKLKGIVEAEKMTDDEIEPCTSSERWQTESKFAVMREGRKTAIKLFDDKESAEKYIPTIEKQGGLYIEERKAECRKCLDYCLVNHLCSFYKSLNLKA